MGFNSGFKGLIVVSFVIYALFLGSAVAYRTRFLSFCTDSCISQYVVSILLLLSLFHVKDSCLFLFNVVKLNKWDGWEEVGVEYFGDI